MLLLCADAGNGMQDDRWVIGEVLGQGANCVVYAATNPYWPGAVLKKGRLHSIREEAELMWQVDHPGLVRLFCIVTTTEEDQEGYPLAYLAMERLGPNLASLLNSPKQYALSRIPLPCCCMGLRPMRHM